jgi:choline kinase
MLDARAPPGESYSYQEQEAQVEQKTDQEIQRLMAETRLWRLANSAQWTAWGIVQAHIPGLPNFDEEEDGDKTPTETETKQGLELDSATAETKAEAEQEDGGEAAGEGEGEGEGEDEEFDYLGYVQERALFAWGDAIQLGIIKAEELPEDLRKRVKIVEY